MSGAISILLCELLNAEHARSHRKKPTTSETHERKRKYEEHHPERKFNRDWQAKRRWLKFEDKNKQHDMHGTDANSNVT